MNTRPTAVAGSFYPADAAQLRVTLEALLTENSTDTDRRPKAIVAPHAGYIYSGATAACVYNLVSDRNQAVRRVVLLGPSHRVPLRGIALPEWDSFQTPLGVISVDLALREQACALEQVLLSDRAHAMEHSLEVHLPFLQTVLSEFSVLPAAVGESAPGVVAEFLELVWGGDETLIVLSTDLSHFRSYDSATLFDRETCRNILELTPSLVGEQACGCHPLNGLLEIARRRGLDIELVDYRNSGDTAGDRDRVVGYGAFALYES